jgi:hypothetical protein
MWYLYTMQYYSAIKKNKICSKMGGTGGHYVKEISQTQKYKYCMFSLICGS